MAEKKMLGRTYRMERMNAIQSVKLLARITKVLGPGVAVLQALMDEDEQRSMDAFIKGVTQFAAELDIDTFTELLSDIASQASTAEEGQLVPEAMDLNELFQVVWWVLQTEYGSFFGASKAAINQQRTAAKEKVRDLRTASPRTN